MYRTFIFFSSLEKDGDAKNKINTQINKFRTRSPDILPKVEAGCGGCPGQGPSTV
jgi:hypothetical protein